MSNVGTDAEAMTASPPGALAASRADLNRLRELRNCATADPGTAQWQAWDWLWDLRTDRRRLATLFSVGTAPLSPRGDCEGVVLGLFGTRFLGFVDRAVTLGRLLGGIGWTGKTFDPDTGTGYNRLTQSSRVPMFFAMPRYGFERVKRIELNAPHTGVWLRNLRRDPRFALVVHDDTNILRYIAIRAHVIEIEPDSDYGRIDRLSQLYEGRPYAYSRPEEVPRFKLVAEVVGVRTHDAARPPPQPA
jgi:hypothetical protein